MRIAGVKFTRYICNHASHAIPMTIFLEPTVMFREYLGPVFLEADGGFAFSTSRDRNFDWQVLSLSLGVGLVIM